MAALAPPFEALVLAGERPGGDPLARAFGSRRKALLPLAGRPMAAHVVEALRRSASVGRIRLSGLEEEDVQAVPALSGLERAPAGPTPAASVLAALDGTCSIPLLVTTADHPLLRAATVDRFAEAAAACSADVAVGIVAAAVVRRRFPGARRTYVRLSDGAVTGANLFAFLTPAAAAAARAWTEVEADRKRPWRLVRRLGAGPLLRFLAGRLSSAMLADLASSHLGARVALLRLADPLAAVDVDRPEDLALAAALLAEPGR